MANLKDLEALYGEMYKAAPEQDQQVVEEKVSEKGGKVNAGPGTKPGPIASGKEVDGTAIPAETADSAKHKAEDAPAHLTDKKKKNLKEKKQMPKSVFKDLYKAVLAEEYDDEDMDLESPDFDDEEGDFPASQDEGFGEEEEEEMVECPRSLLQGLCDQLQEILGGGEDELGELGDEEDFGEEEDLGLEDEEEDNPFPEAVDGSPSPFNTNPQAHVKRKLGHGKVRGKGGKGQGNAQGEVSGGKPQAFNSDWKKQTHRPLKHDSSGVQSQAGKDVLSS
jgi:hypothetical protein